MICKNTLHCDYGAVYIYHFRKKTRITAVSENDLRFLPILLSATHPQASTVHPIMAVVYQGTTHMINVKPGPEGKEEFEKTVSGTKPGGKQTWWMATGILMESCDSFFRNIHPSLIYLRQLRNVHLHTRPQFRM